MTATAGQIDPRVARWTTRRGQGLRLPAAAAMLLAPRLRVRWWSGPVSAVAVLGFFVWWFANPVHPMVDDRPDWPFDPLVQAALYVVLAPAVTAFVSAVRWRDRRIAAALPHRVTRTGAVGARAVLGTSGCVALAVVGVIQVAIIVVLARSRPVAVALSYTAGLVLVSAVVLGALVVILRRPTVALDDDLLAVDEWLRARDAVLALTPWFWIDLVMVSGPPSGHVGTAEMLIVLALLAAAAFLAASLVQPVGERWRR